MDENEENLTEIEGRGHVQNLTTVNINKASNSRIVLALMFRYFARF